MGCLILQALLWLDSEGPVLLALYTLLRTTRGGTQKYSRRLKLSDWLEQWLKWETKNTHLGGEYKKSLFAALFLPVLSSLHRRKTLLYLFIEARWCISLFWSLYLFEIGILWDVIHKCFTAHHFLHSCRVCDYGCEEKLWGWVPCFAHGREGRTQPPWFCVEPQAKFIPIYTESVGLFHLAK